MTAALHAFFKTTTDFSTRFMSGVVLLVTILLMPAPAGAQSSPYDIYSSTPGSCAAIADCSDLTETYFTTVENPPGTYTNCEDAGSSGPHLGTGNTWYIDGKVNCEKVSDGSIHGRGFEYYTTGTLPPECDDGPGLPPDCPIPPDPGFVVEDATPGPCPRAPEIPTDRTNPCNLANGNKLQVEQDYRGRGDGTLSFSRFYNSMGEYKSADNFGVGWRHSYSRVMDERPDKEPLPHAAIQSAVYTSGQSACETGWGDIKTAALGGDLSGGVAVYAGGNSCEVSVGGSVKAILSVKQTEGRTSFSVGTTYRSITRPNGSIHRFRQISGVWRNPLNPALTLEESGSNWIYTDSNDTQETYNSSGQLTSVTYRNGQTETLTYNLSTGQGGDGDGDTLDRVTGPFGHTITFTYTSGRLSSITTPDGTTTYAYDASGNLETVTRPDATVRQYVYDASGKPNHLTGIIDENGDRFATWAYDAEGRAVLSEHGTNKESVDIVYNSNGSTTITLGNGATRTYTYSVEQGRRKTAMVTGDVCSTCPGGNIADRTYDANGFVDEVIDWNFNTTQTVRNARGLTETLIEAKGSVDQRTTTTTWHTDYRLPTQIVSPVNTTDFTHDTDGNVLTATVSSGILSRAWTMTYNANGQVLTIDGPRTDVTDITTLTYHTCSTGNQCGQLNTITNALGHVTTFNSYDAAGRPTLVTDANGLEVSLTYDWQGNVLATTETPTTGTARTTTMTYDDVGQLETVTTPEGAVLTYAYTDAHYLASVTDGAGNKIEYDYDAMGNRIDEDVYDSGSTLKRAVDYTYDLNNRIDTITSAGFETDLALDLIGNLATETDPGDFATQHLYDALNRLDSTTDALSGVTNYDYDAHDNLTQVAAPNGATTDYVYDELDNLTSETSPDRGITTYTHDDAGNVLTKTDARSVTATYTHDALNRVTSITYPNPAENITYTYDDAASEGIGRLRSITDKSGTTTYSYNEFGEVVTDERVIAGVTYTTSYEYDGDGNVSATTYPSGRVINYTRNANGEITDVDSTKNLITKAIVNGTGYEPFGPVATLTYGNGVVFNYTYGLDGRIATITSTGIADKQYGYDAAANIDAITDGLDGTRDKSYTYDGLGRLLTGTEGAVDYATKVLPHSPKAYWRLGETSGTTAADTSGNGYTSTYQGTLTQGEPSLTGDSDASFKIDPQGSGYVGAPALTGINVTGVEAWFQTTSTATHRDIVSLHEGPYDRIILLHYPGGKVKVWQGAIWGYALESDSTVSSGAPHHVALWYEAASNKTYMMIDGVTQTNTYTGNLFNFSNPKVYIGALEHNSAPYKRYLGHIDEVAVYDTAVTAATFSDRSTTSGAVFTYDANGNRKTHDDLSTVSTINYVSNSNKILNIDGLAMGHDAAGNRTSEPGGVRTYTYSDTNRLNGVLDNSVTVATYEHNALGQRTKKVVGSTTTIFIFDLFGILIAEHDATGTVIKDYVWANGVPVAQIDTGEVFSYLHTDHLGTPRLATNDAQTVVWRWDGDAYGSIAPDDNPDGDTLVTVMNLRFPGQYYDAENGFHYNYFRTYDPSTGRYLESDPIGLEGGLNTYGYVGGNPLSYVDPLGLQAGPKNTVEAFCIRYPAECASVVAGGAGAYTIGQQLSDIASDASSSSTTDDPENCDDDDDEQKCQRYKADARRIYNRLAADKIPEYMRSVRVGEGDVGHHMQIIQRQSALRIAVAGVRRHCKNPPLELAKWERLAYQEFPMRHAP